VTASLSVTRHLKGGHVVAAGVAGSAVEAAMMWRFGWSSALPAFLYFGAVACLVSATDLAARRVPNRVILPAYLIGPALLLLTSIGSGKWMALIRAGLAMAVVGGFFLVLALAFPSGMGVGDCKLAGVIGLYLGWLGWGDVLSGILVAYLAAALFVIVLKVIGSTAARTAMPFAPFMAGGALFAVLVLR
jgi:leader peptidase (prepilin peptidase)/N-methyltransferase